MKIVGIMWKDLLEDAQIELLECANAIDGESGNNSSGGDCIVDFEGHNFSISGSFIVGELENKIKINDDAVFYNSVEPIKYDELRKLWLNEKILNDTIEALKRAEIDFNGYIEWDEKDDIHNEKTINQLNDSYDMSFLEFCKMNDDFKRLEEEEKEEILLRSCGINFYDYIV